MRHLSCYLWNRIEHRKWNTVLQEVCKCDSFVSRLPCSRAGYRSAQDRVFAEEFGKLEFSGDVSFYGCNAWFDSGYTGGFGRISHIFYVAADSNP